MLLGLFKRLTSRVSGEKQPRKNLIEEAAALRQSGDMAGAIRTFRQVLETDPGNLNVLNDLGACLAHVGRLPEAQAVFELAYSLDDTFIGAMANHAKVLADQRRGAEAMYYLRRAKLAAPDIVQPDSVYAVLCLMNGEVARASRYQLRAWLGDFDNVRNANGFLFWCGYGDSPESRIASEHRFWAETLAPLPVDAKTAKASVSEQVTKPVDEGAPRRIRIGYWSPDFRGHSVRYFFRPLLENHDRDRFEIFLYHEAPMKDEQTALISAAAEHFKDVNELSDAALMDLMESDRLDVLVDLAGHTSYNRAHLLQGRLARLQVNALGYPPTTGLSSVDAKLVDAQSVGPHPELHYAEEPMVLPTSFWCFDPMEATPEPAPVPFRANGFITFGCAGNIAKITLPTLAAWKRILDAVPSSRLVIRSINFLDDEAVASMDERLRKAQLPVERITLHRPLGGTALWESYSELDIVLDTFPFNGGTTTCFATYMGVPVVSMYGDSLISRMGLSVLSALGAADLAVPDIDAYVERAIALAADIPYLEQFRREARERYRNSSLGNGAMFARDFERALEKALGRSRAQRHRSEVPALTADEIMRRAYAVARNGGAQAARRIVDYCLRLYPETGSAHLLRAQQTALDGAAREAIAYLLRTASELPLSERAPLLILALRFELLEERADQARAILDELTAAPIQDELDRLQVRLYEVALAPSSSAEPVSAPSRPEGQRVLILIPCNERARFDAMRSRIAQSCACPAGWTIVIESCQEGRRIAAYEAALGSDEHDIVILMQKNVEVHNPRFLAEIGIALESADAVSFAGARRWARLDWRADGFRHKAGSFLADSREKAGFIDVQLFAQDGCAEIPDLAILDGAVLAIRRGSHRIGFDEELLGADTLLEEEWSARLAEAGGRLTVNCRLGIYLDSTIALDASNRTDARVHCADARGFDPFAVETDDLLPVSVPAADLASATRIVLAFF